MSNINKQELREAAERAESDSWGYDRDEFNEALTPSTVLALLDELEAKDSMIAAQQHEICTLLNALEGRPCPKCNDTGMADSGGTQPWGEPISVPCDCAAPPAPVSVPDEIPKLKDGRGFKYVKDRVRYSVNYANGWNACRAAMLHGAERVTTGNKLPAIGWLRADYQDDNRGLRGNAPLFVLGKKDPSTVWGLDYVPLTSNSPVIPDGVCPCCGRKQLKNRTCSVSGCDEKHIARGFCIKHYAIERKKDPSRRESIRAADKRYRARKAAAPQQEVTAKPKK
ncbi:ead/Ea22-like family protein [Enterobacter hormaechei]|uniref:ead/Ea22-like family protein n=1 Tax=Enterobacter hormaechei TaxID=158836 RepID=UPI000792E680|nr:ead/Ea22-like family protein [Enterobacter hormaechei]SAF44770.1 Uncharacterised protein [Enterobacter hormaechei]